MHAGIARARGDDRRDDGRRPPERARGHPQARRGGRGRRRRGQRPPRRPGATPGAGRCRRASSTACCAASPASRSPTSAARSTPTGARRSSRCCTAIGRQKFTKALVLSAGASVDRGRPRPRARAPAPVALLAAPPDAARAARAHRLLAAADPVGRRRARRRLYARRDRGRHLGHRLLDRRSTTSRARCSGGRRVLFVLGLQGFILARARRVPAAESSATSRQRPLYNIDESCDVADAKRVLVTGGAGFISSNMIRYLLRATRARGGDAGRAHLRGQHGEPRRRDGARAARASSTATSATRRTSPRSSPAST